MPILVADASALVSLGTITDAEHDPLSLCLKRYDAEVPQTVIDELRTIATYDDAHGRAASSVIDIISSFTIQTVELDPTFPLDDGENAAVSLANQRHADLLLCDEFTQLGLIHASLADTRLVTTPTLLSIFVRTGHLSAADARQFLDEISRLRSWSENSYVSRARTQFDNL